MNGPASAPVPSALPSACPPVRLSPEVTLTLLPHGGAVLLNAVTLALAEFAEPHTHLLEQALGHRAPAPEFAAPTRLLTRELLDSGWVVAVDGGGGGSEGADGSDGPGGPGRAGGPDRASGSDGTGRPDKASGSDRAGGSDRIGGPDRAGGSDGAGGEFGLGGSGDPSGHGNPGDGPHSSGTDVAPPTD